MPFTPQDFVSIEEGDLPSPPSQSFGIFEPFSDYDASRRTHGGLSPRPSRLNAASCQVLLQKCGKFKDNPSDGNVVINGDAAICAKWRNDCGNDDVVLLSGF